MASSHPGTSCRRLGFSGAGFAAQGTARAAVAAPGQAGSESGSLVTPGTTAGFVIPSMPSQQNFIFSARANFQMRQGLPRGALPLPRPSSRQDAIPSGSGMKHEGFHSWGVSEGKGGGSDSNSPVRRKLLVGRIPLAPSPGLDLNPELPEAAVSPQQPPHRAAKMGGSAQGGGSKQG